MFKSVPFKIIGTIICVSTLWTSGALGSAVYDHDSAKIELEAMNQQLSELPNIAKDEAVVPKAPPPPLYKKKLSFLASFIIGEQYGEESINQSLGIKTEDSIIDQLKNFVEILRDQARLTKGFDVNADKMRKLMRSIENGLLFDEILTNLALKQVSKEEKMAKLNALANIIHDVVVTNKEELLIPITWRGPTHGGVLASINKDHLKVFDTRYSYSKNNIVPGRTKPIVIETCSAYEIKTDKFNIKNILVGLINMKDEKVLDAYENGTLQQWIINLQVKYFLGWTGEPGKLYFEKVLLGQFVKSIIKNCVQIPLFRLSIGTVGDIVNYMRNSGLSHVTGFEIHKLEIGSRLLQSFLNRFGSDADLRLDTLSHATIVEIIKRCMNRLVNDAYDVAKRMELITDNFGGGETEFRRHLDTIQHHEGHVRTLNILKEILNNFFKNDMTEGDLIGALKVEVFNGRKELTEDENENFEGIISQLVQSNAKVKQAHRALIAASTQYSEIAATISNERRTENSNRKTRSKENLSMENESMKTALEAKKKATQKLLHYVKKRQEFVGKLTDILLMKMTSILRNEIELFSKVLKLRNEVIAWIKANGQDLGKLRKIRRSLDQREVPLTRKSSFNLIGNFQQPLDLLNYMPRQRSSPDYRNCMAAANSKITTIEEFIKGFDFIKRVWKWSVLRFEMKSIECESFARRNIELLLKNLDLGGMDEVSLKRWTPKNARQYAKFKSSSQSIVNIITSLPTDQRTLEDYIILLRLQRIVWRVAQALDLSFSREQPHRHLNLVKYSLSYPQCHQLLNNHMNHRNYFLADSGAYSNILNPGSINELKSLCKDLIDEENSSKPVLNYQKYFKTAKYLVDSFHYTTFETINEGDREIYYKMAQNPKISSIVRQNHNNYALGSMNVIDNAARACSIGKVGSQLIYYQFFDALKTIFVTTMGIKSPIFPMSLFPVAYFPFHDDAFLVILPNSGPVTADIDAVNTEVIKGKAKSYIKLVISEVLSSHILGLDVLVNHLGRASAKLWSSGSIPYVETKLMEFTRIKFLDRIINDYLEMLLSTQKIIGDILNPDKATKATKTKTKTFRCTIAGNADFLLNCSVHLARKLDVAPEYENLIMSMLMKTISSVGKDLEEHLKKLETDRSKFDTHEEIVQERGNVPDALEFEHEKSKDYLKNNVTSPNEFLKSLINWSVIALRFAARIRGHKHEWRNKFSSAPTIIYSIMSRFSNLASSTDTKLTYLNKKLMYHVDYVLYMAIVLNPNDTHLRQKILETLRPSAKDEVRIEARDDLMSAAMIFHRYNALALYEKDSDGPITEDFISNQFGIAQVMNAISALPEHNESLLTLMAIQMKQFLSMKPKEILEKYYHGSNLANGVLIYDAYSVNLIQGSLTMNGMTPQDPSDIMKYGMFKRFFSAGGSDGLSVSLGRPTSECENRFEVKDYLCPGANYSICEYKTTRKISIYRQIPGFKKPCKLVLEKKLINLVQEAFSVFTNDGFDLYHCIRGNNAQFVWIGRNSPKPSYITYGRMTALSSVTSEVFDKLTRMEGFAKIKALYMKYIQTNFEFDPKLSLVKKEDQWISFIMGWISPVIHFPKLQIVDSGDSSLFPLTSESKQQVVPEPLTRFSGGANFGTYTADSRSLIYMFQQFRFKENPEISLTFFENERTGDLEMEGRDDLKACDDQVFENNFWPALMVEKKVKVGDEQTRFAMVPITNPDSGRQMAKDDEEISIDFDESSAGKFTLEKNPNIIYIEAVPVEMVADTGMKTAANEKIYSYKLKPTSRIQRILLAYHNLRLRNYDESLKFLDPRSEIDHNTRFSENELTILKWMVKMTAANEPEALAVRLIAYVHIIVDVEMFVFERKKKDSARTLFVEDIPLGDDKELLAQYENSPQKAYMEQDTVEYFEGKDLNPMLGKNENSNDTDMNSLLDKILEDIGSYFNYLSFLPKRFRIDHVFRDVMPSTRVQAALSSLYRSFNNIPIPLKFKPTSFVYSPGECDYSNYVQTKEGSTTSYLRMSILEPLNDADNAALDKYIAERYLIDYSQQHCDLPRLMLQRVIQILGQDEQPSQSDQIVVNGQFGQVRPGRPVRQRNYIPIELTELIMLYFTFSRHKFTDVDGYLYTLGHPDNIKYHDVPRHFDLEALKADWEIKYLPDGTTQAQTYSNLSYFSQWALDNNLKNKFPHQDISYGFGTDLVDTLEKMSKGLGLSTSSVINLSKAPFSDIFKPLTYFMNEDNDGKDYNSIKFEPKDLHYVRSKDLVLYEKIINKIKASRAIKKVLEDESAADSGVSNVLKDRSRTQNALQSAIGLYMTNRAEPVEFDEFVKESQFPFKELSEHIEKRSVELMEGMKKMRLKYDKYYESMRLNGLYSSRAVLSSLNRIFNSRTKPTLEDLRDCLMRMSYTCIHGRLPELPRSSINTIAQIMKEFYVQKIILVQFKSIQRKIESFNSDAQKVRDLEGTEVDMADKADLIFGYKDTAVSTIEDIYNDLDKMMNLESRLKDPVTLNFEFMSEKYHLTRVQVEDINNLATTHEMVMEKRGLKRGNDPDPVQNRKALLALGPTVGRLKPYNSKYDAYVSRVIQRKMAAGKTTVLGTAATVKKADGKTLSVLVILSSLYQSSAPDMQKRTSEFFKSTGFSFSMPSPRLTVPPPDDPKHPAKNFLTWTLKSLVRTINTNSYLVVTPETLQSFLNSYVEFLDAFTNSAANRLNPELAHCIHLFATIYDIFRARGSVILDEIDSIMRPQKELNFPTTKREKILLEGVSMTADLLLHSAFDETIIEVGLKLLANQQAALTADKYKTVRALWKEYISTQIEDKKSPWHFLLPDSDEEKCENIDAEQIVDFMFQEDPEAREDEIRFMRKVSGCDKTKFHAMMIFKMQMKNWMKGCLNSSVNEHYGPSLVQQDKTKPIYYAIPYMAANTPAEGSIFADRWETVNKTFMMYLVKKLSKEEISLILINLRDISGSSTSLASEIAFHFEKACPGKDFYEIEFNHQNQLIDKGEIFDCIRSRSRPAISLIFIWVINSVFGDQLFYAEQITSNAINLTTMFPSVQGYSGTIDNVNVLPHQVMEEAEKDHRRNEEANGAIAWKLLQQKDCVTTVDKIEQYKDIKGLIEAMIADQTDVLEGYSAFIDVGALLKDFTNKEVAIALADIFKRDIILYYDERTNQLTFYKKSDKTHIALEGSETNYLNAATNSKVTDRFTYYDQRHITGSDILQPPTAKAFLTIGPKVLLRDILQGVMRMRQFQSGQSIHFVTTSAVEELLSKSCNDFPETVENTGIPRADTKHLLALGALNEDEKQMSENVRLYRVKIDAELRAYILDILTEALVQEDPYVQRCEKFPEYWRHRYWGNLANYNPNIAFKLIHEKLFKDTRPLFIRNVRENPMNWATFDQETSTYEAVQEYMHSRIALIPAEFRNERDYPQWAQVMANLGELTESCGDSVDCQNDKPRSLLAYLDAAIKIPKLPEELRNLSNSQGTEQGSTVEMQLQMELQQELNIELEQVIDISANNMPADEPQLNIPPNSSVQKIPETPIWSRLAGVKELKSPWQLYDQYINNAVATKFIQRALSNDILCPGYDANFGFDIKIISDVCVTMGFVGLSNGLSRVTTEEENFDFATMLSREATHLLFWRGKNTNSNDYHYAVYLLTGSEAISLHANWEYKSSLVFGNEAFYLTDLYGYEVHGSPFSTTTLSSNKFSLLEHDYRDHFADLHFRALVLNGSYNVIISSKALYTRMRIWIGDKTLLSASVADSIKHESIIARIKMFFNRLVRMSKLRSEIVPQDPLIRFMLRIISKFSPEYNELDEFYQEDHAFHTSTLESFTDPNSWEEDFTLTSSTKWKASGDINKLAQKSKTWILIISAGSLLSVASIVYYVRRRKDKDSEEYNGYEADVDDIDADAEAEFTDFED